MHDLCLAVSETKVDAAIAQPVQPQGRADPFAENVRKAKAVLRLHGHVKGVGKAFDYGAIGHLGNGGQDVVKVGAGRIRNDELLSADRARGFDHASKPDEVPRFG
jgi:hypothetical protein